MVSHIDLEKPQLTLGFIPLTDCAPLVVAKEKGFFEKYGLEVTLSKETSWANIRDKLAIGVLDGAHMLAPMLLASRLTQSSIDKPLVTSLSLDLNGNAITVSKAIFQQLERIEPGITKQSPISAAPLKRLIEERQAKGEPLLTFATVYPFSSHNYLLRYWMASAGIDPDRDIRLIVIPPSQMVSQLRNEEVDGYCVGEPWNAMAVREDLGRVVCTSNEIWNNHPEKVLGVSEEWAEQHPATHLALVTSLLDALRWLDEPSNRLETVEMISRSIYVNAPAEVIRMSMMGTFQYSHNEFPRSRPGFNVFHRYAANFPWRSHAVWLMTQMVRWGQVEQRFDIHKTAERIYRPDIFRSAANHLGIETPAVDYKAEGINKAPWQLSQSIGPITLGADAFFDGQQFNPLEPQAYLEGFTIAHPSSALGDPQVLHELWTGASQQSLAAVEEAQAS